MVQLATSTFLLGRILCRRLPFLFLKSAFSFLEMPGISTVRFVVALSILSYMHQLSTTNFNVSLDGIEPSKLTGLHPQA